MIDGKDIGNALLVIIGIPIGFILLCLASGVIFYIALALIPPALVVYGATIGGIIGGIMLIFGVVGCIIELSLMGFVLFGKYESSGDGY